MHRPTTAALATLLVLAPLATATRASAETAATVEHDARAAESAEGRPDEPPPAPALEGLDPILVIEGRQVEGSAELTAVHGPFEYRFATRANLETFERDPARYGIQLGDACAAMPGTSGADPSLYTVHDGRIYIFGSATCREHFLVDPDRHLSEHES